MSKKQIQKKPAKTIFGHPFGLVTLFSTEFCERFSYYGMRAILVFFIYASIADGGLGLTETDALYVMTLFGASVYLLSIIGSWLADRLIGSYRAVLIGGFIIALGHILLGVPFNKIDESLGIPGAFAALASIALGTGLLKPNVSAMVGELYDEADRRRQAGFNLFVLGINLGSLFSPIIVGSTQQVAGYHVAFLVPAAFMFIALAIYFFLSKTTLNEIAKHPSDPIKPEEKPALIKYTIIITIVIVLLIVALSATHLLTLEAFSIILPVASISIVTYLFVTMITDKSLEKFEKDRITAYIAIFTGATIFWAIEESQASIFAVLAETRANNQIGNFDVPEAWYQSINPFVIVILAPILAVVWTKAVRQPSTIHKISFGLFLTFVSFIIPAIGFSSIENGSKISPLLLVIPIILFSAAELFISPIGLSATTELAPSKYKSRLMSMWFLSNTLGQGINSFCVRFFDIDAPANFFYGYAFVTIIIVITLLLLTKTLKRLMGTIK
jgi:POT family proton-dependent oligopeptide transporter